MKKHHLWFVTTFGNNHIEAFIKSIPAKDDIIVFDQKVGKWPLAKAWNDALDRLKDYKTVIICNDDVRVKEESGMRISKILDKVGRPTKTLIVSAYDINLHKGDFGNIWIPSHVMYPQSFMFAVDERLPEIVGKFDEQFVPYLFEDTDMFHRIKLAGYDWASAVPAWHRGGGSTITREEINKRNEQFEVNRQRYIEKWGGEPGKETK